MSDLNLHLVEININLPKKKHEYVANITFILQKFF